MKFDDGSVPILPEMLQTICTCLAQLGEFKVWDVETGRNMNLRCSLHGRDLYLDLGFLLAATRQRVGYLILGRTVYFLHTTFPNLRKRSCHAGSLIVTLL